jgi:hypothetical protein
MDLVKREECALPDFLAYVGTICFPRLCLANGEHCPIEHVVDETREIPYEQMNSQQVNRLLHLTG